MATTLQAYLPNLGKFTVMQFVTPNLRLTPEAAREMSLAQAILRKGTEAILADTVVVTPAGGISAIDVQGALQELDAEKADAAATAAALAGKQPLDATLTALAGLATAADKLSYWSGVDVAALTDFTSFARTLLDDPDAATMRTTLGLGTAATADSAAFQPASVRLTAMASGDIGVATGTSLAVTGALTSSGAAGVGYATGAGGTATQATSKATPVTLDKLCGLITLSNAALASQTTASFVLTNSTIAADDLVLVLHDSVGTMGAYNFAQTPANGSVTIAVRNISAGSLSEAIVLRFAIVKGVTA